MKEIITEEIKDSESGIQRDMTPLFVDERYSTRLLVVRHGESIANAEHAFLGHTDLGLSERGHVQAQATADFLKGEPISAIYSSDLIRAYDTARPNAEYRGIEIVPMRELREIYIGKWENSKIEDIERIYGEEFTVGWKQNFGIFTPPDGEPVSAAAERFHNALLSIAKKHIGECVLITAHAAVIRAFYARLIGVAPERVTQEVDFPYNASVTTVYFDGKELVGGEFSHYSHLIGI